METEQILWTAEKGWSSMTPYKHNKLGEKAQLVFIFFSSKLVIDNDLKQIDDEIKDKIFEPFFTTKEVGKGTGLGLSTVYGIVQQHNGFIELDSEKGRGTTFSVYFPISKDIKQDKEDSYVVFERGTGKILVAEDDHELRNLIRDMLVLSGYNVIEAGDGDEAMKKFYESRDNLDLLILDVILPKMNGKQIYEEAVRGRPDIKVLFISGYTRDIVITNGLNQEIEILQKPFSSGELLGKVREILQRSLN